MEKKMVILVGFFSVLTLVSSVSIVEGGAHDVVLKDQSASRH